MHQNMYFKAMVKAFSGEGARRNRILVRTDDTVLVYDSAAGHYTTCHALSEDDLIRLRKRARRESAAACRPVSNAVGRYV